MTVYRQPDPRAPPLWFCILLCLGALPCASAAWPTVNVMSCAVLLRFQPPCNCRQASSPFNFPVSFDPFLQLYFSWSNGSYSWIWTSHPPPVHYHTSWLANFVWQELRAACGNTAGCCLNQAITSHSLLQFFIPSGRCEWGLEEKSAEELCTAAASLTFPFWKQQAAQRSQLIIVRPLSALLGSKDGKLRQNQSKCQNMESWCDTEPISTQLWVDFDPLLLTPRLWG